MSVSPSASMTVSVSSTTSASQSTSVTPSASPKPRATIKLGGRQAAVIVVAFIVVAIAAIGGFIRNRVWTSPNLGYKSTIGVTLWLASLIAFATAAQSVRYARKENPDYKTFAASYVNYLVAANVMAWIAFTIFFLLDFKKSIGAVLRNIVIVVDVILLILTLAAAAAATKNFAGAENYCEFTFANLNRCTTYQASIFFTYVVFIGLFFKLIVTALAPKASTSAPASRSKV